MIKRITLASLCLCLLSVAAADDSEFYTLVPDDGGDAEAEKEAKPAIPFDEKLLNYSLERGLITAKPQRVRLGKRRSIGRTRLKKPLPIVKRFKPKKITQGKACDYKPPKPKNIIEPFVIKKIAVTHNERLLAHSFLKRLNERYANKLATTQNIMHMGKEIKERLDAEGFVSTYPELRQLDKNAGKVIFSFKSYPVKQFQVKGQSRVMNFINYYAKEALKPATFNFFRAQQYLHTAELSTGHNFKYTLSVAKNKQHKLIIDVENHHTFTGSLGAERRLENPFVFASLGLRNLLGRHITQLEGAAGFTNPTSFKGGLNHKHYFGVRGASLTLKLSGGRFGERPYAIPSAKKATQQRTLFDALGKLEVPIFRQGPITVNIVGGGRFTYETLNAAPNAVPRYNDQNAELSFGGNVEYLLPVFLFKMGTYVNFNVYTNKKQLLSDAEAPKTIARNETFAKFYGRSKNDLYVMGTGMFQMAPQHQLNQDRVVFDGANYAYGFPDNYLIGSLGGGFQVELGIDKPWRRFMRESKFYMGACFAGVRENMNANYDAKTATSIRAGWRTTFNWPIHGELFFAVPLTQDKEVASFTFGGAFKLFF